MRAFFTALLLLGIVGLAACTESTTPTTPPVEPAPDAMCGEVTCADLGMVCGAHEDGCGGTLDCGSCGDAGTCEAGACVCQPTCESVDCGDDGCGGTCGLCETGAVCLSGACAWAHCAGYCGLGPEGAIPGQDEADCWCDAECFQLGDCCADICASCGDMFSDFCCTPQCDGASCGDDGCGGACGTCGPGEVCEGGACVTCAPDCAGKECGDDGCGGTCGACDDESACEAGVCVPCAPDCGPLGGVILEPGPIPDAWSAFSAFFTKHISVFGVNIFATAGVPDGKMSHAAHVLAQYLDNDEDGVPDNPTVLSTMVEQSTASMVMFATEGEVESSGIFQSSLPALYPMQDLYATETHPQGSSVSGGFDATLEEVLHLVTGKGYSVAYPSVFGEQPGTAIGDAMDLARGGQFTSVPASYPEGAWYHYDDWTCDYGCMVTEYFYWALTSILGAQSYPGRCAQIAVEWELCTKDLVQSGDPDIYGLMTDPTYHLPTVLPDGSYGP